jgi:hypothetical protein
MSKRKANGELNVLKNKACTRFKEERLLQLVETEVPSLHQTQKIIICNIFTYRDTGDAVYTICVEATVGGEFNSVKIWKEWKLDYLKHLNQRIHVDRVTKLRNQKKSRILRILTETPKERTARVEQAARKKPNFDLITVLINNIILAITINA